MPNLVMSFGQVDGGAWVDPVPKRIVDRRGIVRITVGWHYVIDVMRVLLGRRLMPRVCRVNVITQAGALLEGGIRRSHRLAHRVVRIMRYSHTYLQPLC